MFTSRLLLIKTDWNKMYLSVLLALYYKGLLIFFLCRKGQILSCLMIPVDFYVMWKGANTFKFVALRYRFMWNTLKAFHFGRFTFIVKTAVWFRKEKKANPKPQNLALWGCIVAFVVDLHQVYFVNSIQLEFKEFATWEQMRRSSTLISAAGRGRSWQPVPCPGCPELEWSCFVLGLHQTASKRI